MPEYRYRLLGLDCPDCAREVEGALVTLPGVKRVQVEFASGLLILEGQVEDKSALQKRVSALGYRLEPFTNPIRQPALPRFGFFHYLLSEQETRLALIGSLGLLPGLVLQIFPATQPYAWPWLALALLLGGLPLARHALAALRYSREITINLLMTLAAIGAVLIGELSEAATLVILFALAEALEGYTTERARRTLDDLNGLLPEEAVRLVEGKEERVPSAALQPGDRVRVRPDERIPTDGRVVSGLSEVNQAAITGESLPVAIGPGDEVFAGSLNGSGLIEVEVTRPLAESTLERIRHLVLDAQAQRAPFQRFVDRFARYYTPWVVGLALLIIVLPPLLWGQPLLNTPDGQRGWLYRGLALLVIACPCALVLSTPITYFSALSAAARRGVLIKGGVHLEALHQVRAVAFDKTGTLTLGQPRVTRVQAVDCLGGARCERCDDLLALAEALERHTRHPLAQAVLAAADERGLSGRYPPARSVTLLPGLGVRGRVDGGVVTLGNHRWFDEAFPHSETLCREVSALEAGGQSTVLVHFGDNVRGYLAFSDTARPESRETVRWLQNHGRVVVLLSGDHAAAAQAMAEELGIQEVHASLLPQEKLTLLQALHARYGSVAMVGDGVNDAPALSAAQVGIAVGGVHSAQAMETADIVLMNDTLKGLPFIFHLADTVHRLVRQNVAFSLITKLAFLVLAVLGQATMWMAVLADMGVSLLVALNGMRPLTMTVHPERE